LGILKFPKGTTESPSKSTYPATKSLSAAYMRRLAILTSYE